MAKRLGANIDEIFFEAMRSIGGKRPTEIDSSCEETDNADIVLQRDNVIAEVKTLMEDPRDKKDFSEKYGTMYRKWSRQGKVPPQAGPIKIETSKIPEECAREFLLHITRRVKANVSKSNRQIRQLKQTLGMPTAKGLLVLCNSGNAFLQPDVLLYGLHHALGRDHSSIDYLIYLTYELPVQTPGMPEPGDLFTQPTREGYDPMPKELFRRIGDAWWSYLSRGTVIRVYDGGDHTRLFDVKHQDPDRPN